MIEAHYINHGSVEMSFIDALFLCFQNEQGKVIGFTCAGDYTAENYLNKILDSNEEE